MTPKETDLSVDEQVAAIEHIPISTQSKITQAFKMHLSERIPRANQMLEMYLGRRKRNENILKTRPFTSFEVKQNAWVEPQVKLTENYIKETQKVIQAFDDRSFNSTVILDYIEYLYGLREEQKRINLMDEGTNPEGPMTVLQIESIKLCNGLLKDLEIVDLPYVEPELPPQTASPKKD